MSQSITGDEKKEAWNYLVFQLLNRLEEEQYDWRSITSSQFSKLPCIADRYLLDELERDIQFPRYWYKYGEVGNREPLDNTYFLLGEAEEWGGIKVRPAKTDTEFELDEELKSEIDEAIEFVVTNFSNVKIDEVKELQYKHFSPNKFIQTFENLRDSIYDLADTGESNELSENIQNDKDKLLKLLDNLEEQYPDETYSKMKDDFGDWKKIMEEKIKKEDFGGAEAYLEEFWDVFSKVHLRMEHNNNPDPEQIKRWRLENKSELEKYRRTAPTPGE
jgi:hypothetical protein